MVPVGLPTLIFLNSTLNIKMVFGEKIPKMGTISDFVTIFFVNIGSKRKTSHLLKKSFENVSEHFVSESIFKRLKFDYSSPETVSNHRLKLRPIFLVIMYSWRTTNLCKSFITN